MEQLRSHRSPSIIVCFDDSTLYATQPRADTYALLDRPKFEKLDINFDIIDQLYSLEWAGTQRVFHLYLRL
eukprot:g50209.t1